MIVWNANQNKLKSLKCGISCSI